jgi:membrane protease YdiL (CAAX protease family)
MDTIKRHPVFAYYALALVISWTIWAPLVAIKQRWLDLPIPFALHYLGAFGPMVSALIVTALTRGAPGLRELWGRIIKWRVGIAWFLFAALSPIALFLIAAVIAWLITGKFADLVLLGQANYLPYLGIGVLPVWLATYGFGEEIGWRGFALPRLQKTMSVSRATLILGLLWAIWHTPAFFYLDTFERIGFVFLPGFLIGVLFGAVLFTWIYNGSGGSVLMVSLWHGLYDLLTASLAAQGLITILMSAGVIVWGLLITNVDRPGNFHRVEKQTL